MPIEVVYDLPAEFTPEVTRRLMERIMPGYALFDTLTWRAKLVEKAWWAQ